MLTLLLSLLACTPTSTDTGDTGTAQDTSDTEEPYVIGPDGEFDRSDDIDGVPRDWVLYVPASATEAMEEGPVPLLVGLHGAGDTGSNFVHATRLTALAEDNGFVVLGPDGYNRGWFVDDSEGWGSQDGNTNSLYNDLAFMSQVVSTVGEEYRIDPGAVFAVGHSRGAGMSAALAIGTGQLEVGGETWTSPFAAYGVNAGYDPYGGAVPPADSEPKHAVWVIHGSSDGAVPYSYGQSLAESLEDGGFEVRFTRVSGADHTWLWQAALGQDNQDLWDWFMAHRVE